MSTINQAFDAAPSVYSADLIDEPAFVQRTMYVNNDQNSAVEQMKIYVQEGSVRHVTPVDSYETGPDQQLVVEGGCSEIEGADRCSTLFGITRLSGPIWIETFGNEVIPSGYYLKFSLGSLEFSDGCLVKTTSNWTEGVCGEECRDTFILLGIQQFEVCNQEGETVNIHTIDAMNCYAATKDENGNYTLLQDVVAIQDGTLVCCDSAAQPGQDYQC
jgi:hypothetical protein